MKHPEFITAVAERASVSPDQAEIISRATLQTLADRISGGEAEDIATQLPETLRATMRPPREKDPERFGLDEFIRRVSERAGIDAGMARDGARAVFTTLRDAVGGEFGDAMDQLPKEFGELTRVTAR